MALLDEFRRVSKARPCPMCGRGDWCLVDYAEGDDPVRAVCQRIESPQRWGDAGWLHTLDSSSRVPKRRRPVLRTSLGREYRDLSERLEKAVDPDLLHGFAADLGIPASSLRALGVGLAQGDDMDEVGVRWASHAWTFPMANPSGRIIGIRVRLPGGKKLAVRGSRSGLFVPRVDPRPESPLIVAEGETDTAALVSIGLDVVGRPGCRACTGMLVGFVRSVRPTQVSVMADGDGPGVEGATALASSLRAYCKSVSLIHPPPGIKDARAWVIEGARRDDLLARVRESENVGLVLATRGGRS